MIRTQCPICKKRQKCDEFTPQVYCVQCGNMFFHDPRPTDSSRNEETVHVTGLDPDGNLTFLEGTNVPNSIIKRNFIRIFSFFRINKN